MVSNTNQSIFDWQLNRCSRKRYLYVRSQRSNGRTHASTSENIMQQHPYVGMWVTNDGRIRHELLADGRYDEARGNRESAYRGRYEITGNHIEYWDDTGFTADGDFVDGNTLHHGGMVFRRKGHAA
ncbi:Atu4866 domain-containing protein [Rhizobium sp. CIAT894]|uniref:Atu4866 domain-containing protein n=1 Tax=Rhizobium sp. CIAT894 TaxID=2020312 RepID=UPI001FD93171|nr:Atu4866 domain-containing protein [Rhizobium sp. CIAT894]